MDLHARLKKIATGVTVADAIQAHLRSLEETEVAPESTSPTEELMATIEIMFLMAAVDGHVSDEEVKQLRASLEAIVDTQAIERLDLDRTMADLAVKLAKDGWSSRLSSAARQIKTPEARGFTFRLAAAVAFVDDFVAHAEAAGIDSLAAAFEMSSQESQEILREVHEMLFG